MKISKITTTQLQIKSSMGSANKKETNYHVKFVGCRQNKSQYRRLLNVLEICFVVTWEKMHIPT